MAPTASDVTLVRNAIHNPADPRHFMRVTALERLVTARIGETELARSRAASQVREVGYDIYDPVVYFPRDDVDLTRLRQNERTTHCPLKGDTAYFDAVVGDEVIENAAWSYVEVIDVAAVLRDLIAFDTRRVRVVVEGA